MSSTDLRQRAIALLDQLPQTKLAVVVQLLEVLAEITFLSIIFDQGVSLVEIWAP